VTSDEDTRRNRWYIHRLGTSLEDSGTKPQCIDVLLAAAIGDLEEDIVCNDQSGKNRVLVEIQNVESGGYLGYTSFLGVYHSRISEPQFTSFVLENVGRNAYVLLMLERESLSLSLCLSVCLIHTHWLTYPHTHTHTQIHALPKQRRDT
jgi:hypothetical protein